MDFEKFLADFLTVPKTLEEAITYVKNNTMLNSMVEDIAFKQTVLNILVAAGLVSENDFNASVGFFRNNLYEEFGKELLAKMQKQDNSSQEQGMWIKIEDMPNTNDDTLWPDDEDDPNNKA